MKTNKKIFLLALMSLFLLTYSFGLHADAPQVISIEENCSTAQDAVSSESVEVDQTISISFQENSTKLFQGEHQMLRVSSLSNSGSFSRHLMCKDHTPYYQPIDPTTTFRPSDTKAVCLTTVSVTDTIEFRWFYRSNSSKAWVSCYNWSANVLIPGEHYFAGYFLIAGYWPGSHCPKAYKVDVYLDGSFSFEEFFEVTNGGLNSPRMCGSVDMIEGRPVNAKSRFTVGVDAEAHHFLRFDKIAYFNQELGYCHNFTTVWIQPNGSTYKMYSGSFEDYKDINATWNYWKYGYAPFDYIPINSSTPVGNWKVEVYLDSYYFNNTHTPYGPIATTPFIVGSEPVADWTFMVYLDADINIEWAAIDTFINISSVGSTAQVNIVVQMDRISGYDSRFGDWTDCRRFNVTEGMTPTPGNATETLGEVNMGDPNTLTDFVNWTINSFPANRYCLVLWDHGTGCMGVCFDFTSVPVDALSLPELSQALSGLQVSIDVIFLDACSMSMAEVAYQIRNCANVLVGPEGLGYGPAPYDDYLSGLINNSSMLPSTFAKEIVNDYMDWCTLQGAVHNATMAATDLTKITSLIAAIDDFAVMLKENENIYNYLSWGKEINSARNLTEEYIGPYADESGYYIDLYNFTQSTCQYMVDEELQNAADQVMTTLESTIIAEDGKNRPDSHGLSIFFPDEKDKYDHYRSLYEDTTFAKDISWDDFVKYHLLHQHQYYIIVNSTHGNPTPSKWVDEGQNFNVAVTSPTETIQNQTQWNCTGYRIDDGDLQEGTSYSFENVKSPHRIEFHWIQQFWLQVDTAESGSTVEGTGWYDADASVTVSATTPYQLNSTHRFAFKFWTSTGINEALITDPSSPLTTITMNNYSTVQANWQIQYYLTVNSAYGTPTGQDWYDPSTQATFSVRSPVDHDNGTRRVFIWWTGDSNATTTNATIIMDSPHIVTANWKTQHYLTMSTNFGSPIPGSGWHDAGSVIQISASAPSVVDGETYVWLGWTGTGDGNYSGTDNQANITINSPLDETASWRHEYRLIMDTSFGTTNPLERENWYEASSAIEISATSPNVITDEQYIWLGWTGTGSGSYSGMANSASITMNGPINETAIWRHEYYLTTTSSYGSPMPESGWFEAGKPITASIMSPVSGPTDTQYACTGWTGTGSAPASGTTTSVIFTINKPSIVTWNWKTQYLLTVRTDPAGLSPQPNIFPLGPWYDDGTVVNCTAQGISGYAFDHWIVDGVSWLHDVKQITITMDGPLVVVAHMRELAWWELLLQFGMGQVVLLLAGIVIASALVGAAWIKTRRRRGIMKPPAEPVPIEVSEVLPNRITTGHEDLDNLLFGGIPKNYAVILTSPSCDEKDLLIKRILETGTKKAEVTFYVTIDPGETKSLAEEFQSDFYLFICNPQADKIIRDLPNVFKIKGVENLNDISIALTKAFRKLDASITAPRRVCIGIVSDVLLQHHTVQTRRWLTDIIAELKSRGFTTLAVINPTMHSSEEVHAIADLFEGEINIYERAREERFLKIKKMYNQRYSEREIPLKKGKRGSEGKRQV